MPDRDMGNKRIYEILTGIFFLMAVCLRLLLFWANPPDNSFDDHFEPIFLLMEEGAIPAKEACWECFQPPVFYLISATVGNVFHITAGSDVARPLKLLQFLPFLYGILTVYIVYLILKRIRISDFARILAFGMVCFLPRLIYMSAMHTNDSLSYLLVSLAVYLMLIVIDREISNVSRRRVENVPLRGQVPDVTQSRETLPHWKTTLLIMTLMVVTLLAIFTKSTALILLPAFATVFVIAFARRMVAYSKRVAAYFVLLLLVPMAIVSSAVLSDLNNYDRPLPLNIELLDVNLTQPPGGDSLSFTSFKPWTTIKSPVLAPGNVESFWTLIYSRMWFDLEPKFLQYTDPDPDWWDAYDDYLNRHDRYDWPGKISLSLFSRLTGSTLIALGIVPLVLILIGIARALFGKWALWSETDAKEVLKVQLFLLLLLFNLAGIIFHTYRHPYYSFMKATFVLNALSSFALFLALGLMWVEKYKVIKWGISIIFGLIFLLTTIHILYIVQSLGFGLS